MGATAIAVKHAPLYPKQQASVFAPERISVIEASTKSGKTYACMLWLLDKALQGEPGEEFWWVAPVYSQAKIAYRRMTQSAPPSVVDTNDTELRITLNGRGAIWFKGADNPDTLYGEDVHAAVIDEATRCKEEAWHAIRTTLTATRGPIRIIGNVKGRRNWAYRMARRAEAGEPDMHYTKITALDAVVAGVLDAQEIDDARRQLPENVFRELYLAEPSDDGGNPFGLDAIARAVGAISPGDPWVWGWDLAKSRDWTVGTALDADGNLCRFERYQRPWQDTIRDIRNAVGDTPALIDSTGVGDPVLEALQAGKSNYEGFKFTAQSKQQLMEGLAVAIQQGQITYPDGPIVAELESFEYEYSRTGVRYSAPEGLHDDCVMALALAWHHYQHRPKRIRGQRAFAGPPRAAVIEYRPR